MATDFDSKVPKDNSENKLEREDDKGYYSHHWIIMRQMKRMRHPVWRKAYSHQAAREHPEWWEKYFAKYGPADRTHIFARISFAKSPGSKKIITA